MIKREDYAYVIEKKSRDSDLILREQNMGPPADEVSQSKESWELQARTPKPSQWELGTLLLGFSSLQSLKVLWRGHFRGSFLDSVQSIPRPRVLGHRARSFNPAVM